MLKQIQIKTRNEQKSTWTNHKASGAIPFRQMVQNWSCLTLMHNTMYNKNQTSFQQKHLVPAVKHGSGGLMIWVCSAVTRPWHLAVILFDHKFLFIHVALCLCWFKIDCRGRNDGICLQLLKRTLEWYETCMRAVWFLIATMMSRLTEKDRQESPRTVTVVGDVVICS